MKSQAGWEAILLTVASLAILLFLAGTPASTGLHGPAQAQDRLPVSASVRPGSLRVAILRGDRSAVPGATVRVFWAEDERYFLAATGVTDRLGFVTLSSLPTGGAWVIADAPGFARRSTSLVLGPTARSTEMILGGARTLRVSVEDEHHAPVPNATLLVNGGDTLPFGALSDATGRVVLSRLGPSPWKLRVAARGYESETRSDVASDQTFALRRASVLDVLVADGAGHPVNAATVFVGGPRLWPARTLSTGTDGHAKVAGLDVGAYDLKAERGPLVSETMLGLRVEPGVARSVTLVVAPGRMIPLLVTDGEGDHPVVVPNADVWVVEGGVSSFPIQGRTGRFGTVTLGPVARGEVVASARADGFIARGAVLVPDDPKTDVRIPLLRGATLRGEVVDPDGHPVDGATVEVIGTDTDGMPVASTPLVAEFQRAHFQWALPGPAPLLPAGELGVTLGVVPPIPTAAMSGVPLEQMPTSFATTEPWVTAEDGTFRATPVPPGRVRALVRHPSYVEATSEVVDVGAGGAATVHVVLRNGGALEGIVVDEAGLPVAGARVEVSAIEGPGNRATTTADDGTFAFGTLAVSVSVSVARPEEPFRAVVRKQVVVPDGLKTELQVVLPALRDPVEISAEDDSGRPVPMAQVTALSLDAERPLRSTAFTDDAGRATVADAVGLPLRLVVEAPGFARVAKQLDKAPAKLVVELLSGVIVEGHVTAVRGRRDVQGAIVELLSEGQRRRAVSDAEGRYRFSDVTPGSVHLVVSHAEYGVAEADVTVTPTGRADRSFDVDPIDLADPGSIAGKVIDTDGRPVAGARVGIGVVNVVLPVGARSPGTTVTDADGVFRLDRVSPGKVGVEAFAVSSGRGGASVSVDSGRTTEDVTIRLRAVAAEEAESAATGGVAVTLAHAEASAAAAVLIAQVAPGSEAERAGLLAGDKIESIDAAPPSSAADAERRLAGPDGSDVVIEITRRGVRFALRVRRERVHR